MECDLQGLNEFVNVLTFPFLNYKDLFSPNFKNFWVVVIIP